MQPHFQFLQFLLSVGVQFFRPLVHLLGQLLGQCSGEGRRQVSFLLRQVHLVERAAEVAKRHGSWAKTQIVQNIQFSKVVLGVLDVRCC